MQSHLLAQRAASGLGASASPRCSCADAARPKGAVRRGVVGVGGGGRGAGPAAAAAAAPATRSVGCRAAAPRAASTGSSRPPKPQPPSPQPRKQQPPRPPAQQPAPAKPQQQQQQQRAAARGGEDPEVAGPRVNLPPGDFSRVRKAVFVGSAVDVKGCPPDRRYPEFAVIGRSNVGKSSLINMLTGSEKLARVSKEPGMTKTINHYLINDSWYLVDLPGYGYARASKGAAASWLGFTKDYFLRREALLMVLLLVDASLPPQPLDLECADWLAEAQVPFTVVFTKADSKKKSGPTPQQNMAAFKKGLLEEWDVLPACFATSSREGQGRTEVLGHLASLRALDAGESTGGDGPWSPDDDDDDDDL